MDLLLRAHVVGLPQIFDDDHVAMGTTGGLIVAARSLSSFHAILLSLRSKLILRLMHPVLLRLRR